MSDYPGAVADAVIAELRAPARIESTGGGCRWLNVGPLPGGAHLTITDGDAGLPAAEDADTAGWLVQRWTGDPGRDEDVATEQDGYPPFVAVDTLTVAGLLDAVRRALSGGDHR